MSGDRFPVTRKKGQKPDIQQNSNNAYRT